ncbi:VOC family protein [uncultured Croceitalea sp.]|uniref:VOC family protein n=1 Tax=uncultured Croceitalea sp. TaxID=1798908 RepID=UPI003305AED6
MSYIINGIQQIGIGVTDAKAVYNWYKNNLGFDILVFEDKSEAKLMTEYTNDEIMNRYALLSMNLVGGGGLEIWQFVDRTPVPQYPNFNLGDLGINMMKLRSSNKVANAFLQDPWNNWVQIVRDDYTFCKSNNGQGGVMGAVIGVSDMEKSLSFYKRLFGFDIIKSDSIGTFKELEMIPGGTTKLRRVLLSRRATEKGGFGKLLGPCVLELVQALDRTPNTIYKNRWWGDLGYIHLCFDVAGIDALKKASELMGYPFTVDSANSFDMGEASGRFGYIEDPDGTLIELVETHKVPIVKKLGIYINLKKRNPGKPLPNWIVKAMKIHRRKKDL